MQNIKHKYQDTSIKTRDTSQMSESLVSKSLISKTQSLCNILVTPNKKGDCCASSYHPNLPRNYPHIFERSRDNTGKTILVILFFLITKTLQMYVFI